MSHNFEAGNNSLIPQTEVKSAYLQAQEAKALYENADQVAAFKESLAADTLNNIPHVTEERKQDAASDIRHVEEQSDFEQRKYADAAEFSLQPVSQELSRYTSRPVQAHNFKNPEPVAPEPAPVAETPKGEEVPTVAQTVQAEPEVPAAKITEKHETQLSADLTEKAVQAAQRGKNEGAVASLREVADGQGFTETGTDNAVGAVA